MWRVTFMLDGVKHTDYFLLHYIAVSYTYYIYVVHGVDSQIDYVEGE